MRVKEISERELVHKSFHYFKQYNSDNKVYLEVPIFSSSADMVMLQGNNLYAIEFKVNDWQRAIQQAKKHSLVVEYCFICIPKPKTPDTCSRIESAVEETGVGLYYFKKDGEFEELIKVIEAKKSSLIWPAAKNTLVNFLNNLNEDLRMVK